MFIRAIGLTLLVFSGFGLLIAGIEFYGSLTVEYKFVITAILAFAIVVAFIYAVLWLEANPMPDRED